MTAKFTASADGTKVIIGTAAEDALQIDATAKTIKAVSPYLMVGNGPIVVAARAAVSQSTPLANNDYTIIFDLELTDSDGAYNPTNGVFTAPVSGYYQVNTYLQLTSNTTAMLLTLWKNAAAYKIIAFGSNVSLAALSGSGIIYLAAGDALAIVINTGATAGNSIIGNASGFNTNMSIALIRAA